MHQNKSKVLQHREHGLKATTATLDLQTRTKQGGGNEANVNKHQQILGFSATMPSC
jgi:hypothetical protein